MKQRYVQHQRQVHLLELEDRDSQPLLSERPSSWEAITQQSISINDPEMVSYSVFSWDRGGGGGGGNTMMER